MTKIQSNTLLESDLNKNQLTKINVITKKKVRDNTKHNCDVLFQTKLTISGDNYRYNKKNIEVNLLKLELINDNLPKYSKYKDDIMSECLSGRYMSECQNVMTIICLNVSKS